MNEIFVTVFNAINPDSSCFTTGWNISNSLTTFVPDKKIWHVFLWSFFGKFALPGYCFVLSLHSKRQL
jgi:hypothetical protein